MIWPFNRKKTAKNSNISAKRAYAAAQYSRLVSDWMAGSSTADAEIKGSLRTLRNRTRQLGRDNDFVRSYLRAVQTNVIGQGIPFQSQVVGKNGALDEMINTQIETVFARWGKKESCHTAGKLGFSDIERLLIRSVAESGEVLVRLVKQPFGNSKIPLALEIIEADMLDEEKNGQADNGNLVKMGVEFDEWQRPVAYHFLQKNTSDYVWSASGVPARSGPVRVPAEEIIHLFVSERPNQTRGVPWMASSILTLHHVAGFQEATVISARGSAALMGFITSPEGELRGDDVLHGEQVTNFESGVFKYLGPGENVIVPNLPRPNAELGPFMNTMLRSIAAGAGCSFETLAKDYSQSNYSSSRLALIDDRDNWRALQSWMIENFHQRVLDAWLDAATLSGAIKLPGYEINPDIYKEVRWQPRGWSWVDPAKETNSFKEMIKGGLTTMTDVIAQSGGDINDLMMRRKRELDLAKSLGLKFDTDAASEAIQVAPQGQELDQENS